MKRVTVAICTWNRAALLDQTLTHFCRLSIPKDVEWELLLINNNSTDNTEEVTRSFADRLPIRHVLEIRQGQSNARNRAIQDATGDLLIFTDDDVLVDETWLSEYAAALDRWPDAGYFGGLIEPWFEHEPPKWLVDNQAAFAGMLVARNLGPVERVLAPGEEPYGANMAFRLSAIKGRLFDPNLGLTGDNAIRFDESVYCRALRAAGLQGVWLPKASIRHFVIAERLTLGYVRKYYEGTGRSTIRAGGPLDGHLIFGAPRWLYRQYWEARIAGVWRRARGQHDWVLSLRRAAEARGTILENRLALRKNAQP